MIRMRYSLAACVAVLLLTQAAPQPTARLGDGPTVFTGAGTAHAAGWIGYEPADRYADLGLLDTIRVGIVNTYDVTLATMGIAGVHRSGRDVANGTLTRDGSTYHGTMRAHTWGDMDAHTLVGDCVDHQEGTQEIYAVAIIEPARALLPTDSVRLGSTPGDIDLIFYFFPETAPVFSARGRCQEPVVFEGYGNGPDANEAPDPLLPQYRPRGEFLPFNDSRWTTQNGLRLHAPPAGANLLYEEYGDWLPEQQVRSWWTVNMTRGMP